LKRRFGYSPRGYIEALALATRQLALDNNLAVTPELLAKARSFGSQMLHPPMVLLPGVCDTLTTLKGSNHLILVTKGDQDLQCKKLDRSGLRAHFKEVYVLREKDKVGYLELVRREGLDPANTWMIGNSPKSDINPAIEAGLRAIFIPHASSWSAECVAILPSTRVTTLPSFADLVGYFNHISNQEIPIDDRGE
jgi:putative hydrolase of the HAD superfamily